MKRILVLLSTYNGEKYVAEQIESILKQNKTKMEISILVRDDGSTDKTCSILEEYKKKNKLEWYSGDNLKSAKSFVDLIFHAGTEYDYYAFCDQDDYWCHNKLYESIIKMENDNIEIPKICYCNIEVVNKNREHINTKKISDRYKYFDEMMLTYCVPGCTMVFNNALLKIARKHRPQEVTMHDCWIYFLCVAIGGQIYSTEYVGIQYRQHEDNVVGATRISTKRKIRMIFGERNCLRKKMVAEILEQFKEDLKDGEELNCLKIFSEYSDSFIKKVKILKIKNKMAPKRAFIKSKLRVMFNSL